MTKCVSLENHMRKLAIRWSIGGLALTLGLSVSILYWLPFQNAKSEIEDFAESTISANRTDLLSGGDIRAMQLEIQKELHLRPGEQAIFLRPNKKPWLNDFKRLNLEPCSNKSGICENIFKRNVISYTPIFFDSAKTQMWGYLYIEKSPPVNWALVMSVVLSIILGMAFQTFGFYFNFMGAIRVVADSLRRWSSRLSVDPKKRESYGEIPFTEIAPIVTALSRLRGEIEELEHTARTEGALSTLRGVGHDILNPVAKMDRILDIIEPCDNGFVIERELFDSLSSNLSRLSSYAEQLKFLYREQSGEIDTQNGKVAVQQSITDLSKEVRLLARDMRYDPEALKKNISFVTRLKPQCFVAVPKAAIDRLIENLCANAIHASPDNAKILIDVSTFNNLAHLQIKDHGKGMDNLVLAKIFDAGFTTRPSRGTGLGLFVVKEICNRYGGKIKISSNPGEGTTFIVSFTELEAQVELQDIAR